MILRPARGNLNRRAPTATSARSGPGLPPRLRILHHRDAARLLARAAAAPLVLGPDLLAGSLAASWRYSESESAQTRNRRRGVTTAREAHTQAGSHDLAPRAPNSGTNTLRWPAAAAGLTLRPFSCLCISERPRDSVGDNRSLIKSRLTSVGAGPSRSSTLNAEL
jgi:hypothetical protein